MARLLIDDEWYEAIDGRSWYERDFEAVIEAHATSLFPGCHILPFKIAVESEHDRKIPDLALIDHEYRQWSVIEVEMAHHSLNNHVLPQVEVFSRGAYGEAHVDYLARQSPDLDRVALLDMVKGAQPRVVVVVNEDVPAWTQPIRNVGGEVLVVEVFRSLRNRHSFRVIGEYAVAMLAEVVTACRADSMLPNLVVVDSPAGLGVDHGERIEIAFNDRLTEWERMDVSDSVWLRPVKRSPLALGEEYEIRRTQSGRLAFRPSRSQQG